MFVTAIRTQFQVWARDKSQVRLLGELAAQQINVVALMKKEKTCFLIVGHSDPADPTNAVQELHTRATLSRHHYIFRETRVVEVNLLATIGVPGTFYRISKALWDARIPLLVTYSGENESSFYDVGGKRCCVREAQKVVESLFIPLQRSS